LACDQTDTETVARRLEAECVRAEADAPAGAWICGEALTLECDAHDGANTEDIYVIEADQSLSCEQDDFVVSDAGPFLAGEHLITVSRVSSGEVCSSTLTVVDTTPPVVNAQTLALWPPNHKMHRIDAEACALAQDICDSDVEVHFTYATSDESVDDNGDGNTDPDVIFGCDAIEVRAERQGGSNGRVYTFGWRAIDDAGNETTGECYAVIAHDQSGDDAIDDGEAYRLDDGGSCD
jgi:hypothetical protein